MKIEIWQIGKKKNDLFGQCNDIYLKRLQKVHEFKFKYFKEMNHKHSSAEMIKAEESATMIKSFEPRTFTFILDESGKQFNSIKFAKKLKSIEIDASFDKIVFCIGGAYGFDNSINKVANFSLSLSEMTFPHKMVKLFLIEQIYRAHTINSNHNYHKY